MKKFFAFVTALTLMMAFLHGLATESISLEAAGDGERLLRALAHLVWG